MAARTACPSCNAWNYVFQEPKPSRARCSRCHEQFLVKEWQPVSRDEIPPSEEIPNVDDAPPQPPSRLWRVLPLAVCLGCMIAAGWFFFRPEHQQVLPGGARSRAVQPPLTLMGLRHCPASTNVLLALQPAAWIERRPADARTLIDLSGDPGGILTAMEQAGFAPKDIEQMVCGISLTGDRLVPGITLYVRLMAAPTNETEFLQRLQAVKKPSGKTAVGSVYSLGTSGLLLKPLGDGAYLLGLSETDLVQDRPLPDASQLSTELRSVLANRLDPASLAWAAVEPRDWSNASPLLQLPGGERLARRLAALNNLTVSLSCQPELYLNLSIETRGPVNPAVAEWLRRHLPPGATIQTTDASSLNAAAPISLESVASLIREALASITRP